MKKLFLSFASVLIITCCFAYQTIEIKGFDLKEAQKELTEESLKLEEKIDARLPVISKAQAGKVIKHKQELPNFPYTLFILGGDSSSLQWLKDHAAMLEVKHALGFITNIDNPERLQEFQHLIKAPLLPANIDDLLALLHESHYPLISEEGELWQ